MNTCIKQIKTNNKTITTNPNLPAYKYFLKKQKRKDSWNFKPKKNRLTLRQPDYFCCIFKKIDFLPVHSGLPS